MFKHPKYYKELRKRNKSDQAISWRTRDGGVQRAPDPGLKKKYKDSERASKQGGWARRAQASQRASERVYERFASR